MKKVKWSLLIPWLLMVITLVGLTAKSATAGSVDFGYAENYFDFRAAAVLSPWSTDYPYSYDWSFRWLTEIRETGSVKIDAGAGFGGGLGFSHFFNDHFGFGLRVDYQAAPIKLKTDYKLYWHWNDGRSFDNDDTEEGTGDLTQSAASIFASFRLTNGRIVPRLNLGLAFFNNNVSAKGLIGYAGSYNNGQSQYIDYFWVPVDLKATAPTAGALVGFDLDFAVTLHTAFRISANYYFSSAAETSWKFRPGSYTGEFDNLITTLSGEGARERSDTFKSDFGAVKIDPSFFVVGVGLVIGF